MPFIHDDLLRFKNPISGDPNMVDTSTPSFNLLDLSPSLWLDADDNTTIVETSGAISEWQDKSGNNRHATQGDANRRPLLQSSVIGNVITFDGADDLLQSPYSINGLVAAEFFVVTSIPTINKDVIVTGEYLANSINQGFLLGSTETSAILGGRPHGGSSYINATTSYTAETYNILEGKIENTGITSGVNGVFGTKTTYSVTSIVSGANFNIGCNNGISTLYLPSDPSISKIVAFSRLLTQSEREKVEGSLAWETGLQDNLPTNHPYKNSAP